ncbi:MAG: hypothetical protein SPI78_02375, partial [Bergeyella zoohelcum]|nr:hypothetical protein [Bergeyella zoohelcum]
ATDETASPISAYTGGDTKVAKITEKGYYYYNGTEWVKAGSDATDQLWAQRDNGGVTETYLKPADANSDFVGYRNDRKFSVNLGSTSSSDFSYLDNTTSVGNAKGQIPHSVIITSDALPAKAELGANNSFFFTKSDNIIRQGHLAKDGANLNATYRGHELTITAKDITSNMRAIVGTAASTSLSSNNSLSTLLGAQFITAAGSIDGAYAPTVTNNIGARIFPRNYGTSTLLRGLEVYPQNYGVSDNITGALFSTKSRNENNNVPAHTVKMLRGIDNRVFLAENAVLEGGLIGIKNDVRLERNADLNNKLFRGIDNSTSLDSVKNVGQLIGTMTALRATNTEIRVYEDFSNYAIFDTNTNVETYAGYRFSSPTINTGSSVKNLYGIRLYTVDKGTNANYGLYVGNVSGATTLNRAIHTEAGQIRFGDLKHSVSTNVASTGDRPVFVTADGVLKVGNASTALSRAVWETDGNHVKLAVKADGTDRTDNIITINDAGQMFASSFKGTNGATIFPDYVFQKYYTGTSSIKADYNFKSLSQIEDFVKTNGHLPGYKSAATIKAQGYVDLMETQLTNVEKIEELYLHSIEQDKALKAKNAEIADLKQRLERLEKLIQ